MTFENDFVHVEMFCIKEDTKIEPAWRFVFHLIPFREKQDGELLVGFRHKISSRVCHRKRVSKRLQFSRLIPKSGSKNVALVLASLYLHSV